MQRARTFSASRELGRGEACFDEAVRRLMSWQVQRGAGFRVEPPAPVAAGGEHDVIVAMWGLRLRAPVRIREVIDVIENGVHRRGFTYETRPGHPENGHESFVVEHDLETDDVRFLIDATSRPGRWWVALGAPVARCAQDAATKRYLAAIQTEGMAPRR